MPEVIVVQSAADYQKALMIRRSVFVEEQGVPLALEVDEHEDTATHFLCLADGSPVAAGRIRQKGSDCKFERIATLASVRGQGMGVLLMKFMEQYAAEHMPHLRPYMHAQLSAAGFYERLGWRRLGPEFVEAGIAHVAMTR